MLKKFFIDYYKQLYTEIQKAVKETSYTQLGQIVVFSIGFYALFIRNTQNLYKLILTIFNSIPSYIRIKILQFFNNLTELTNNVNINIELDFDYLVILPEIGLIFTIIYILIIGIYFLRLNLTYKKTQHEKKITKIIFEQDILLISKVSYLIIIALSYYIILLYNLKSYNLFKIYNEYKLSFWHKIFQINTFIIDSKIFLTLILIIILIAGIYYLKYNTIYSFEYIYLILLSYLGMIIMMSANDLIIFYISLELQSLALYILIAYRTKSLLSTDASLKYFILGAFASGIVLLGISILYSWFGSIKFDEFIRFINLIQEKKLRLSHVGMIRVYADKFESDANFIRTHSMGSEMDFAEIYIAEIRDQLGFFRRNAISQYLWPKYFSKEFKLELNAELLNIYENKKYPFFEKIDKTIQDHLIMTNRSTIKATHSSLIGNSDYNKFLSIGLLLILVGIFFKLAIAPFHIWAPDIYEGSPTFTTFIIATLPKISIFVFFINFYLPLLTIINISEKTVEYFSMYTFGLDIKNIAMYAICFSLFIGTINGLNQIKIKRLLAYSTIVNASLALLPIFLINTTIRHDLDIKQLGTNIIANKSYLHKLTKDFKTLNLLDSEKVTPVFASIFYFYMYILSMVGIFLILLTLRKYNNLKFELTSIYQLSSIVKNNKFLAILFTIFLFSLAGIPPLVGFFNKFYIFLSILITPYETYYKVASLVIFVTLLSTFYYLRIIRIMFFNPIKQQIFLKPINKTIGLIIILITLFNTFFIIFPEISIYFIMNDILESFKFYNEIFIKHLKNLKKVINIHNSTRHEYIYIRDLRGYLDQLYFLSYKQLFLKDDHCLNLENAELAADHAKSNYITFYTTTAYEEYKKLYPLNLKDPHNVSCNLKPLFKQIYYSKKLFNNLSNK